MKDRKTEPLPSVQSIEEIAKNPALSSQDRVVLKRVAEYFKERTKNVQSVLVELSVSQAEEFSKMIERLKDESEKTP